jgi:hypothetical protein
MNFTKYERIEENYVGITDLNLYIVYGDVTKYARSLIQDMEEKDWPSGWLYNSLINQKVRTEPYLYSERSNNDIFFPRDINLNLNNCIVHAINFCLRTPLFVNREQIYTLIKKNKRKVY